MKLAILLFGALLLNSPCLGAPITKVHPGGVVYSKSLSSNLASEKKKRSVAYKPRTKHLNKDGLQLHE